MLMGPSSTTTPWMAPNVILCGPTTDFLSQNDIALTPRRMTHWPLAHAAARACGEGIDGKGSEKGIELPEKHTSQKGRRNVRKQRPVDSHDMSWFPKYWPVREVRSQCIWEPSGKDATILSAIGQIQIPSKSSCKNWDGEPCALDEISSPTASTHCRRSTSECRLEILLEIIHCYSYESKSSLDTGQGSFGICMHDKPTCETYQQASEVTVESCSRAPWAYSFN